jgi:hypothetical protein
MAQKVHNETPSRETAVSAYRDDWDYIKDQLEWLDHSISLRLHIQEQVEVDIGNAFSERDEASGARLFEQMNQVASYGRNDRQTLQYSSRLAAHERQLEARIEASSEAGVFLSIPYLSRIFGLTPFEQKAIVICLAIEVDRKYESAYELLQREGTGKYPTPDLIATLVSQSAEERQSVYSAFDNAGALRKWFLQKQDSNPKWGTMLNQPLKLEQRIVRFITNSGTLPDFMEEYATLIPSSRSPVALIGNTDIQSKLTTWISNRLGQPDQAQLPLLISLWGKQGSGKITQVTHACQFFNEPMLVIDMIKLARDSQDLSALMDNVYREATIQQAVLVLSQFQAVIRSGERGLVGLAMDILDELSQMGGIVFLLSEEPCQPLDRYNRIDLELEIAPLQDEERAEAWKRLATAYEVDDAIDWEALSARFLFNPGQMANALRVAKTLSEWNSVGETTSPISWHDMIQASYKQTHHTLGSKSKRLSPKNSWNELILPAVQKDKLQHACNHIQYKHTVYGRWGFNKKLSYGTGISLLFSGPPGTGKTMASEIVAKELDMEIYKIDLSQIISKYIGETEKNLSEIFDEAQASYAVLFFDEADALFGKRSEVKDSHDKNANTEVAYLLQKMEEYRGISILATNYLQNMDEAFLRRINYVIRFPFPDEKQRETIWQHVFPVQTPLEKDLDFGFLARKLQMAGGSIKNIALTSAFLASGQEEKIGMKHIFKAYQYELDKTNRALTKDDLGEYAYLYDTFPTI